MTAKAFISYSHADREWVEQRLVPVLEAAGVAVLVDWRLGTPGVALGPQIAAWQTPASHHLLVLSPAYLTRPYCRAEMHRAIGLDPDFRFGTVIAVEREACELPPELQHEDPLRVDLRDDRRAEPWALLLKGCEADLGVPSPHWLEVRDEIRRCLADRRSVNLVVHNGAKWRPLVEHLKQCEGLGEIDLESWEVAARPALLESALRTLGSRRALPERPRDLLEFGREIMAREFSRLALIHFDMVEHHPDYANDVELFAALRHLINERRKLALLIQSRTPFQSLLPRNHPLSEIDMSTVTLQAQP